MSILDKQFTARLQKSPNKGTAISKRAGETVTVHLEQRLDD